MRLPRFRFSFKCCSLSLYLYLPISITSSLSTYFLTNSENTQFELPKRCFFSLLHCPMQSMSRIQGQLSPSSIRMKTMQHSGQVRRFISLPNYLNSIVFISIYFYTTSYSTLVCNNKKYNNTKINIKYYNKQFYLT